jgi:hypothetical protein
MLPAPHPSGLFPPCPVPAVRRHVPGGETEQANARDRISHDGRRASLVVLAVLAGRSIPFQSWGAAWMTIPRWPITARQFPPDK